MYIFSHIMKKNINIFFEILFDNINKIIKIGNLFPKRKITLTKNILIEQKKKVIKIYTIF